jgi:hypothetical protein
MQYNIPQYNTINTIQHNTIQHNTVQYNTRQLLEPRENKGVTLIFNPKLKFLQFSFH